MHNFFTRIFLSFWAVIVLIAASVAAVTAIDFAALQDRPSTVARLATDALNNDGLAGLKVWLAERNRRFPEQRTLIIDGTGKDILAQKLPEFRRRFLLREREREREGGRPPPDGRGGARGEGPFGPPPPDEGGGPGSDVGGPGGPDRPDADRSRPPDGPRQPGGNRGRFGGDGPRTLPQSGSFLGLNDGLRWLPVILRGKDGSVFRMIFDPPPRRGPFSPPFSWWVRAALLGVALAVSGLVSYLLARSISTPVRRLQAAAHTLSAGDLDARAGTEVTKRKDELGVLGREFDSMADRLSSLIDARQRLLRDISHELRSPLARMEMAIGLARQDPGSTPEQLV